MVDLYSKNGTVITDHVQEFVLAHYLALLHTFLLLLSVADNV